MTDEKYTREIRDGKEYLVYPSGIVKEADTGHIIHPPNSAMIKTSEQGRQMAQRKKDIAEASQLRALARASGLDPDTLDIEQMIQGAGNAVEALLTHFYATFLKSSNLRGMAESYRQIAAPLVGEIHEIKVPTGYTPDEVEEAAVKLLEALREALQPQTVEGRVTDPKG